MKQWVTAQNGLDNLRLVEAEKPSPKDGEVLVQINAVSLNYRDTEVVMGLYSHHKAVGQAQDLVPCSDICGTIVSSRSPAWKEGQRVMGTFNQSHVTGQIKEKDMKTGLGLPLPGCLTEFRCFPAEGLVAVPDYLTDEEAATLPIASVTAWMAINGMRPMGHPANNKKTKSGVIETVLLQGTGGVATAGLQIAHAAGLKTIITSSSDSKLAQAKKLGADAGINYRTNPEWQDEVNRLSSSFHAANAQNGEATGEAGADIIFENGGAQTLRKSFDCIAFGGLINCIGYLSGKEDVGSDKLHTNVLALRRNVTIKGIINGPRDRFEEMVRFYAEHQIRPVIDRTVGFEEAKEGLKYLFSGSHFGKVVVKVS
ncbi:NAD(P)-binding protein [Hortaea werneckii]|uniref:Enoyl reductase (ER) domain-containing protein n=1 Tax=Hortaea werneckii TaxID=91943 RepID=A0A3M7F753_HORWE|nr:NAD(P)-binding protein [Hortaea werneckii]KAI6882314.1 NAD(P)-binding protein [Hortaea werneckii]KAI6988321.1 NAD(P)-binding protein [Hortaea werneckii]KAI7143992.1 NAD(P)-binding protein [Hortaea werneckii]KAI7177790.1 NAD(P)-binding protein [Hortaea werneckii]